MYLSESNNVKIMLIFRVCKHPDDANIQMMLIPRLYCIIELTVLNALLFDGTFFQFSELRTVKRFEKVKNYSPPRVFFRFSPAGRKTRT